MADETINSEPLFESQGTWGPGYVLAKNEGAGVTVGPGLDNANIFAQLCSVGNQKRFRMVARARSANVKPGKARFQVNWMREDGQHIASAQKTFEVNDEEIIAEFQLSAPHGTAKGALYVAPGGNDDHVVYYEMSLYPDHGGARVAPKETSTISPICPQLSFIHHSDPVDCTPSSKRTGRKCDVQRLADKHGRNVDRPKMFWENLNRDTRLAFVHIPKTAGYSVYDILNNNYPEGSLVLPRSGVEGNIKAILSLTPEERTKKKVIAGHMPVGLHKYFGDWMYMTFLRNPFELIISSYYFNLENEGSPTFHVERGLNRTLLQFAEYYDNIMTRYLTTCAFLDATFWLSGEIKPGIKGVSYLGLECAAPVSIRSLALQQWNAPLYPSRYVSPGFVEKIAVEYSDDCFQKDVREAAVIALKQNREMHSYDIPPCGKGKFWRIRALSEPESGRWGIVGLKFFEPERRFVPPRDYGHLIVRGAPICSSEVEAFPASNAFDDHDLPTQWQIPVRPVEMCHCEEAMENLRERIVFGLTERFDESIRMMGKVFGWSNILTKRINAAPIVRNVNMLSSYEKREIAEMNQFDLLLYEYGQRLFESDLEYIGG